LTLVTLPRLDKTQLSSAWFTALDATGVTLRVDPIERRMLPAWLAQRLKAQGQRVAEGEDGQRALAFFADRVEGNLLAAHQELQKLALLHPAGELSLAQIQAAVLDVARFDVFKLSEAVLSGAVPRVLRMLDGLEAEGEAAVLVHWTLAEDIRALARVRAALDGGRPLPLALREARVWGAKEKLLERLAPRVSAGDCAALVSAAQTVDGIAKGLRHPAWPLDAWAALKRLALMLAETAGAKPGLVLGNL
jgi:DNA polymerase-3 subunit delta